MPLDLILKPGVLLSQMIWLLPRLASLSNAPAHEGGCSKHQGRAIPENSCPDASLFFSAGAGQVPLAWQEPRAA